MPKDLQAAKPIARLVQSKKPWPVFRTHFAGSVTAVRPPSRGDFLNLLGDLKADLESSNTSREGEEIIRHGDTKTLEEPQTGANFGSILEGMPLSPLIHPELRKARQQFKRKKEFPAKEKTEFQKALEKNPFAHMLAEPVRTCALSGIRQPSSFHIRFALRSHPSGNLFYLPTRLAPTKQEEELWAQAEALLAEPTSESGLDSDSQSVAKPNETDQREQVKINDETSQRLSTSQSNPRIPSPTITAPNPSSTSDPTMAGTYITCQQVALKQLSTIPQSSFFRHIPNRWKSNPFVQGKLNRIVRRQDLDTFTLDLMRRQVVSYIHYLCKADKGQDFIRDCKMYVDVDHELGAVQERNQIGAVLWAGGGEEYRKTTDENSKDDPMAISPPPYATIPYRGRQIPLFNLRTLLGDKHLEGLRRLAEKDPNVNVRFRSLATVKNKKRTLECRLSLWKLMGYVGDGMPMKLEDGGEDNDGLEREGSRAGD
ncbi:MAG: hypothetical protein MMC33_003456 [Icmadophila ericetorum]|nr:hypothetical protein [Icmadophila ericetorum]